MTIASTDWKSHPGRACRGRADLFQASVLDYDPADDEFADLTAAEHAALAAEKAQVEEAAVDACFGCPVMLQCEAWAMEVRVSGVAGGRTQAEREAIIESRTKAARAEQRAVARAAKAAAEAVEDAHAAQSGTAAEPSPAPQPAERAVCPSDRGKRGKIDDATVAHLTSQNWKSTEIARYMKCDVRTITRARHRLLKDGEVQVPQATEAAPSSATVPAEALTPAPAAPAVAPSPVTAPAPAQAPYRAARRTVTPDEPVAPAGPLRSSRVSAPMKAIYDILADGQWHDREALLNTGVLLVTDEEALAWWENSIAPKSKNPRIYDTERAKRIVDGARDKVSNALGASCRVRKHTERGGPEGTDNNLFRLRAAARDLVSA